MSFKRWLLIALPLIALIVWLTVRDDSSYLQNRSVAFSGSVDQSSQKPRAGTPNKKTNTNDAKTENSAPSAQKPPINDDAIFAVLQKYDPKGKWSLTRSADNRITTVSGSLIPGIGASENSALIFVHDLASSFGIPSEQVVIGKEHLKGSDGSIEGYHFDQSFGGYLVDNGYIRTFIRPSDKAVYFVTNELRDLGDVDTRINYGANDAEGIILETFQDKRGVVIDKFDQQAVIYNIRSGLSELVWRAEVKIEAPLYDRRLVMISTTSGRVVLNQSMLKF